MNLFCAEMAKRGQQPMRVVRTPQATEAQSAATQQTHQRGDGRDENFLKTYFFKTTFKNLVKMDSRIFLEKLNVYSYSTFLYM